MNVNFGQKCFKITILKTVIFFHWRRVHLPSIQWNKGICHCRISEHSVQWFSLPEYWAGTFLFFLFFISFFWCTRYGPGEDTTLIYKKAGLGTYSWNYMVWHGTASLWADKKTQVHFLSSSPLNWLCSSWVLLYRMSVQM